MSKNGRAARTSDENLAKSASYQKVSGRACNIEQCGLDLNTGTWGGGYTHAVCLRDDTSVP